MKFVDVINGNKEYFTIKVMEAFDAAGKEASNSDIELEKQIEEFNQFETTESAIDAVIESSRASL
jgi:hypothetical protein